MKRISKLVVAALGISLAGSAFAFYRDGSYFDFARVDRVDRLLAITDQPQARQECWDQPRTEYHPGADYRRNIVEPIYDEDGNPQQTVVRSNVVETSGYTTTHNERICQTTRTANIETQQVVGYDIVYSYRGQDYHERVDHDPGRSVRVHVDHGYVELAE